MDAINTESLKSPRASNQLGVSEQTRPASLQLRRSHIKSRSEFYSPKPRSSPSEAFNQALGTDQRNACKSRSAMQAIELFKRVCCQNNHVTRVPGQRNRAQLGDVNLCSFQCPISIYRFRVRRTLSLPLIAFGSRTVLTVRGVNFLHTGSGHQLYMDTMDELDIREMTST